MSKEGLSLRIPEHIVDDIDDLKDQEGMNSRSEAAREVIRRGLDAGDRAAPGERLAETATGVSGAAALLAAFVIPQYAVPFGAVTFLFAVLWAAIMARAGRDLV